MTASEQNGEKSVLLPSPPPVGKEASWGEGAEVFGLREKYRPSPLTSNHFPHYKSTAAQWKTAEPFRCAGLKLKISKSELGYVASQILLTFLVSLSPHLWLLLSNTTISQSSNLNPSPVTYFSLYRELRNLINNVKNNEDIYPIGRLNTGKCANSPLK